MGGLETSGWLAAGAGVPMLPLSGALEVAGVAARRDSLEMR